MSLLQKFTKLFKTKDELLETLGMLLKPKSQKEFEISCEYFGTIMRKCPVVLFSILRENIEVQQPKAENLLNLLFVIHTNIEEEAVCTQLRGPPIFWLDKLMRENKESFIVIERMICEASTSSFFPQPSPIIQTCQSQTKTDLVKDKRKQRQDLNEQLKNPVLNTEVQLQSSQLKPKIFCIIYYSYLQKLSVNLTIYESSKEMKYPFNEPDDVKLRYIWIYKIQNIMMMGLKLLECNNQKYQVYQQLIYKEMIQFTKFIRQEIEGLIDHYATIPNLDCLSLYEIFQEYQRARTIIENYNNQIDLKINVSNTLIQEFLSFSVRLKVLNQFTFKKSIKVPNRDQPNLSIIQQSSDRKHHKAVSEINKENFEPLNIQDLQYNPVFEQQIMEKKFYENSTENSVVDIEEDQSIPQRPIHFKGLSTFQQS